MHFKVILYESRQKPNNICVDQVSEFYNRSMNSWLLDNEIEIYSTHNEGKFVIAIYKYSIKNV